MFEKGGVTERSLDNLHKDLLAEPCAICLEEISK